MLYEVITLIDVNGIVKIISVITGFWWGKTFEIDKDVAVQMGNIGSDSFKD